MLYTRHNNFEQTINNFGATYTDAGYGTSITASGTTNTKGSTTQLLSGATVTDDVYGVAVTFAGGTTSATVLRFLVDIQIDNAGGTSWTTLIPNLLANSPSLNAGGYRYYFPIFIKAGSSIGARCQSNVASRALRVGISLSTRPSRPDMLMVGSYVEAFGVVTASTSGTAVTPGTSALGSYSSSLGTLARDLWWWQWGGIATNDTTITAKGAFGDVSVGDATNKRSAFRGGAMNTTAAEEVGMEAMGETPPIRYCKAGENVYVRVAGTAAPDTTPTTTAYGMGG
jgi:hypothetical protein